MCSPCERNPNKLQLKALPKPDENSKNPECRFVRLCATAKPEIIQKNLENGADPNAVWTEESWRQNSEPLVTIAQGDSALIACVRNNPHPESALLLLQAGADINARNGEDMTPLMEAVKNNRTDMVSLLLQQGADADAMTEYGLTALHIATHWSPESIPTLIAAGVDIHAATQDGDTALHFAAKSNRTASVKALLDAGFPPNTVNAEGNTALHKAANNPETVELLIQYGADVNLENEEKLAPFEMQCSPESLKLFLEAGVRLLEKDDQGKIRRVRGFAPESTVSTTRFFKIESDALPSTLEFAPVTPLQQTVLSFISLETPQKADLADALHYSEKVFFSEKDSDSPITFIPYCIGTEGGLLTCGRTALNGCTVRVYTSQAEAIQWDVGVNAFSLATGTASFYDHSPDQGMSHAQSQHTDSQGSPTPRYGERFCFMHPEKQLPLTGYPYFIRTKSGYGISGITGENGCSAEIFPPHPESDSFAVYGGKDAQIMNIKGPTDFTFP
ncbi:hypothetical protein AAG570_014174 [Ranatra chinensis]|uniref:Ankyrin repeat domain-containing protein n=1 Tax=Ranatra chinensis TaxID=642074 RepID=A0ABD0XS68_9HEMI